MTKAAIKAVAKLSFNEFIIRSELKISHNPSQPTPNDFMNTAEISGAMKFWKRYRELIQNAINYKEINNMDFTCENLEMAYKLKRKPLHQRVKENRERQKNIG